MKILFTYLNVFKNVKLFYKIKVSEQKELLAVISVMTKFIADRIHTTNGATISDLVEF